jgi:hypothetical protein
MKKLISILSILFFISVSQAQISDSALVQLLITKHHFDIRREFFKLGIPFTQKKQIPVGKDGMKYIFLITGPNGNTKPWEVYTERIYRDSVRVSRIIIKYYYKKPGDLIDLDYFDTSKSLQFIDDQIYSFIKSEGKKQAYIEITTKLFSSAGSRTKSPWLNFSQKNLNDLFLQFVKDPKAINGAYWFKAYLNDVYTCVGSKYNSLIFELDNSKYVHLHEKNEEETCGNSAMSIFYLTANEVETLKNNNSIEIRIVQDTVDREFKISQPDLISNIIKTIDRLSDKHKK